MACTTELPNVFGYNDFRAYLRDYQLARSQLDPSFTKTELSRRLGLPNSRSYISDVLRGKPVTPEFAQRFVDALELNRSEGNYFRTLVKHNQCDDPDQRALYFEQLIALNRTPRRIVEKETFEYYRHWYNSVIRALLDFYDFKDDYADLARRVKPPITAQKARESVALLRKLNLVAPDKNGFLRPTDKALATQELIQDEIVRQFQMQCFELATHSIASANDPHAQFFTNTISISESAFPILEGLIGQFRSQVRALAVKDTQKADRVYSVCLSVVPTTRKERTE